MIGLKTVDSFSQEEAGQGYVDDDGFHKGEDGSWRAPRWVRTTQK